MENPVNVPPGQIPIRKPGAPQAAPVAETQYPTEVIELPSKGWFYDENSPLSSGQVEMKMMTAKEEDILTNQNYVRKGIVFEKLLQSLIVTPGVDINDALLMDQNALMVAARRLAYTDSYNVDITCPQCGDKERHTIDLGKIEEKEVDLNKFSRGVNRFEYKLPRAGNVVVFKLLTQRDENQISEEIKQLHKGNKLASAEVTTRLKHMIISVDGNDDRNYIKNFVMNMLAMDARSLRDHMNETLPSIDMTFDYECSNCDYKERMDVPLTVQFFWPDSGR